MFIPTDREVSNVSNVFSRRMAEEVRVAICKYAARKEGWIGDGVLLGEALLGCVAGALVGCIIALRAM